MTTCILPTKTALAAYKFSPIQLNLDAEVETFLTVTNDYDFLLELMSALRAGESTSFTYISTELHCQYLMYYLTQAQFGYEYTVTPTYDTGLTLSNQAPTPISSGANAGKFSIIVAWA